MNRVLSLSVAVLVSLFALPAAAQPAASSDAAEEQAGPVTMYVFKSATCPHCNAQREFTDALDAQHPALQVRYFEIMQTREHHDLLRLMAEARDVKPGSVPMVFLSDRVWVGDSPQIRSEISEALSRCLARGCPDARVLAKRRAEAHASEVPVSNAELDLPLIGKIDLSYQPLLLSTALIAFVDGFNPCSLWLLTILIALVIHSGSRQRIAVVGLSFLVVTALVYGLFITGVFSVLAYASFLPWMYWIVAIFALVFGLVNIKDYFWFKLGISFTIDDKHKPGIFKKFRALMSDGKSMFALAGATAVMASGIALIELPCTAGFPVIWSGLVSAHDVSPLGFAMLLGVYLVIYLLDELVVFGIAVVKLRIDRFEERHARVLKLAGGVIMVFLAVVLVTEPEVMSNAGQAIAVFALSFALTALIVFVDRQIVSRVRVRNRDRSTGPTSDDGHSPTRRAPRAAKRA